MSEKKTVSLAELVEMRRAKQNELAILAKRIKTVRKEIREKNKQIQANLDAMITTGSKEEISENNFGWEDKRDDLMGLIK